MKMLERIYAEAGASLAAGDLHRAQECLALAAGELRAIADALCVSDPSKEAGTHRDPCSRPRKTAPTSADPTKRTHLRRIVSRDDLRRGGLRRAQARLATLAAQAGALHTLVENSHQRLQEKRKLLAVFESAHRTAGTLLDRNG